MAHSFLFRTYIILYDPWFFPVFLKNFLYPTSLIFLKWSIIFISNRDLNAACRNRVLAIVPDLTAWLIVVGSVIEGEDFFGSVGRLLFHTRAYQPLKLHCCKEEKKLTNNRYAIRFISIWFCLQGHRRWPLHCNLHCPILQKLHHVSHPCLEVPYARYYNPLLIWNHSRSKIWGCFFHIIMGKISKLVKSVKEAEFA